MEVILYIILGISSFFMFMEYWKNCELNTKFRIVQFKNGKYGIQRTSIIPGIWVQIATEGMEGLYVVEKFDNIELAERAKTILESRIEEKDTRISKIIK